mgnify:CR=1 FL=1
MIKLKKKITIIIGGGIAAYKSLELIRHLQSENFEIIPVLTKSASNFITSLSISAISKNKVYTDLFDLNDESEMGHIQLSRISELIIVAPATANLIAKFANGIADDLATTLILATDKKVLLAPSMNVRMWNHVATKENIKKLKNYGFQFVGPNSGEMACGEFGLGRMAEPLEIKNEVINTFKNSKKTLKNEEKIKKIRDNWKGKLVLKGVSSEFDVKQSIRLGIDGIIISNHGGRQLDAGPSSIKVLEKIAPKYGDKIEIMMDSGIRSGPDISRTLATGAKFTFLGRSFMYGVCALGKKGGDQTIHILNCLLYTSDAADE